MTSTTPLPADVELVVVTYLRRTGSRVEELVDDRVYTTIPKDATYPLLRVVRVAGGPVRSVPLHLEAAVLQLDAYGGSKADARRLIDTARAELADVHLEAHADAVVSGVTFGAVRYFPEPDFTPPKPRYSGDVTVYLHPAP
jgi:hypothetical protein